MYGIFTYIGCFVMAKNMVNVGKYTSPMDPMGNKTSESANRISTEVEFLHWQRTDELAQR